MTFIPKSVRFIEVGPRDGLQNEPTPISSEHKVRMIQMLQSAGLVDIEVGSFVSPKWVPQMADTGAVFSEILSRTPSSTHLWCLVPNQRGLEEAINKGVKAIAVFTAASESFNQKNINATTEQSLSNIAEICYKAKPLGIKIRGYISCVMGCPYEGNISETTVAELAQRLLHLGCDEISLGDTIGVGTPFHAQSLVRHVVKQNVPIESLAIHFHDTYGQALANILACLECGITQIDSAISGLGGCPYAPGASGNVATEDVAYMLHGMGIRTGLNMDSLLDCSAWLCDILGRPPRSRTATALLAKRASKELG